MIERPDVDALMAGELGQFLGQQVQVREDAKAKRSSRWTWSAVILLPILSFLWFAPIGDFRFFIAFAFIAGAYGWGQLPVIQAKNQTKEGINSAIAGALGLDYARECEPGHGFDRAKRHKMFPSFDKSSVEDLWCGDMAGHAFTLREVLLEEQRGSGKNRRWVKVFRGPVITIGGARDFLGTHLLERSGKHRKFGFFGEKDELKVDGQVLQRADMVHPDFEDAFTLFTTDQVEARYIVHPTYIEELIAIEVAFNGQDIATLFKDSELTIILKTENMFESGNLDHTRDREMVEMATSQFMAMADLCRAINAQGR
ncbi:DUF3137 domain-containing protein [Aurantiacibacter gangjinensis]|uniref:Uncharacterized protein n=1 Tax=Aurantiacibacter gangjinensis TaxID=502682 RepID=A0A0G9MQR3_9SPHN|nr:DUF3137 domain-containing protein [Aurantiacibacter gangjinensis]APE28962.1 putative Galanin [Aurantiacibacter gangjinensis]KLE33081.1 hypothetical protein AAW01_03550 [Aurantiacibacter gangjinensis]